VSHASGREYYSSLRTQGAIDAAEVVGRAARRQRADQRAGPAASSAWPSTPGRALVIAFNKWDLVDEDRARSWPRRSSASSPACSGRRAERLGDDRPAVDKLGPRAAHRARGLGDPHLHRQAQLWIGELVAQTPPPVRSGKQPKILFATQAGTRPPRFVLFTSGFLEAGYRRFVERRLREDFGFAGSPIEVSVKVREKNRS
jgi:GTP-binding protein